MVRVVFAAVLVSSLGAAAPAVAQDVAACDFTGRFGALVRAALGATRAARAGYVAQVMRADGTLLCSDEVNAALAQVPASTIKVLVAVAALRRVDRGEAALAATVAIQQPNAGEECKDSSCAVYGPGRRVTVQRLLTDMIVSSNNVATNQLIDLAGKPFIAETAQLLGAAGLAVNRKLYNRQPAEPNNPTPNSGTAGALAAVYRELVSGRLGVLSPTSRALLVGLLGRTLHRDGWNRLWPSAPVFAHKLGSTSQVAGDAGFFWIGPRTAVVVAGLQPFVDFVTMGAVGKRTLELVRTFVSRPAGR